ncbi:MAG TPA: ATP-binding protein, partial [Rugosimonospora sp.]|nr:ATP-binding protein [Rugosimonospora sp.]
FRKVFDNSRTGMILADPTGRFVRVNPALCQMLGHAEPDLVGKYFTDITHPDDGTAGTDPARYVHADGHTIEASVTTALLRDESGRPQYLATQIIDVTERRALERAREQHEAELAHRAEQLQQANTQMSDFIAMLTHDVRQPLASVVALGEVLLDEWGDMPEDTKRNYVQRATTAGHRASQLVSDILTLAQMDAGALVARPVRLDVAHAVREAVAAHAGDHEEPVSVVAPDESSAFADPAHLQLVLGNLLGNAAKYGAPPISVTVTNDRNHVRIQITDCGEGVPPAFVARMFDRFARAESGVATTKPGTGLGLYFVRQLAGASGMTVHYRPNLPRGATFILTVPRTPGQSQDMDDRQDVPAAVR